ncbi:hypothetical protein [Sulfolobus sp. S-194]|uniref:hypothetical protein n=1 Tax=Sulfolobus sp. S-194 TaxID=2512240 RepID=UPI002570A92B|nr:hypothetical protein [Sulfolobus sp. S-194]
MMRIVIGFIPFFATPAGRVIEEVYDKWKDKDFVIDLETDPVYATELVKRLSPDKVLLVGSSRYAPEGISEKEFMLENKDPWYMLELVRPGLDGRFYLEDVAYGLLIFGGFDKVYAIYYNGDYSEAAVKMLEKKVEEKYQWLLRL